jgi:HlyD family secretion protein
MLIRLLALAGVILLTWFAVIWARPRATAVVSPPESGAPVGVRPRVIAEGRIVPYPGARIVVSTEVPGLVTNLPVREKSPVAAGALLAEIQADDVQASLLEARAHVGEIEADLVLARREEARARALSASGSITPEEFDRRTLAVASLEARRTTGLVRVRRLEITLGKTRLVAPFAGTILERHVHPGEVVAGGTPVVTLADLDRRRVEAEVDEYDAGRVRLGAKVTIRAEGHEGSWAGQVEEIPDHVGARDLRPQDPARPSDLQILRVKVAFDGPCPLKLGQRVDLEIGSE